MGLHYTVTPQQWETLNKGKSPRRMTDKERSELEKLYKSLLDKK